MLTLCVCVYKCVHVSVCKMCAYFFGIDCIQVPTSASIFRSISLLSLLVPQILYLKLTHDLLQVIEIDSTVWFTVS